MEIVQYEDGVEEIDVTVDDLCYTSNKKLIGASTFYLYILTIMIYARVMSII